MTTSPLDARRRAQLDPVLKLAGAIEKPVHRRAVEVTGSPEAIGFRETREQLEIGFLCETTERAVSELLPFPVEHSGLQMVRDEAEHLAANVLPVK